jgi:hypothetical protein
MQRWWNRLAHRLGAARRGAEIGRRDFSPHYRHSSFGKPRFGRFETRFHPRQWLRRALLALAILGLGWVLWQSWLGIRMFDY